MAEIHSERQVVKSSQESLQASVITKWAPSLSLKHFNAQFLFYISLQRAEGLIIFEVKEMIGPA
jgi:hypothetical protein